MDIIYFDFKKKRDNFLKFFVFLHKTILILSQYFLMCKKQIYLFGLFAGMIYRRVSYIKNCIHSKDISAPLPPLYDKRRS